MIKNIVSGLFVFVLLLAGCTFHKGQLVGLSEGSSVDSRNKAVGLVVTTYVFGIGGNRHSQVMTEAKDNLVKFRPLQKGESYSNVVFNRSKKHYGLWWRNYFVLTADVVGEPLAGVKQSNDTTLYNLLPNILEFGGLVVNNKNETLGEVISFNERGVGVRKSGVFNTEYKFVSWKKVFCASGSRKGMSVGQELKHVGVSFQNQTVVGLGVKKVLVVNSKNEPELIDYPF